MGGCRSLRMNERSLNWKVSDTIGTVSGILTEPQNPWACMTLAHGAGAGMQHVFMKQLADALAAQGVTVLRFNFPYMENKKGRPDVPAVAHATVASALDILRAHRSGTPVFLSGKSFGGRMTSQYVAAKNPEGVRGLVFFGFPLYPAGKPSVDRADHLKNISLPMLFLQGTRDTLAELTLITPVCDALPTAKLITIDRADHGFKAGKENNIALLANETVAWMREQL
jgi:predicted alpha/beta-hydrolase family hydrolase